MILIIVLVSAIFPTYTAQSSLLNAKIPRQTVDLSIIEAFYTDLDNDEFPDVVGRFHISIDGSPKNGKNRLLLFSALELPSGKLFFKSSTNHSGRAIEMP